MRLRLSRGKRIQGNYKECGKWAEGYAYPDTDGFGVFRTIIYQDIGPGYFSKIFVDPDTIGYDSGLTDKSGKKIWEDDIVKEPDDKCIGIIKYEVYDNPFDSDGLGGHMGFYVDWQEGRIKLRRRDIVFWADKVEVIGNIFDNPELLKEGE